MNRYQTNKEQERLLLKRHKHLLDIDFLKDQDRLIEIRNRMPQQVLNGHDIKVNTNSTRAFNKTKTSFYKSFKSLEPQKKLKGFSMDLTLPRNSSVRQQKQSTPQTNFNNFYLSKPNLAKTIDFDKTLSRQKSHKSQNNIEYIGNLAKKYQQFYFSNSNKCKVNYDLNKHKDQKKGRVISLIRRKQDIPTTILDDDKIAQAKLSLQPRSKSPVSFSKLTGKDRPSVFDLRVVKDSQFHWKKQDEEDQQFKILKRRAVRRSSKVNKQSPQVVKRKKQ